MFLSFCTFLIGWAQLSFSDLTEVPPELLRMTNIRTLRLDGNRICSLPKEIAHLTKLKELWVRECQRWFARSDRKATCVGLQQRAHVSSARARSADKSQVALRAAIEAGGS